MRRVAILGGTFDPIHIGHLALANWFLLNTELHLDQVLLVPTVQNPLKKKQSLFSFEERVAFIQAAIQGDTRFECSTIEASLPSPHYTFDTLEALHSEWHDASLCFIMGSDSWCNIKDWYRYQELITGTDFLIYPRRGTVVAPESLTPRCYLAAEAPLIEISSTYLRDALRKGEDVRFFLPQPNLIHEMQSIVRNGTTTTL